MSLRPISSGPVSTATLATVGRLAPIYRLRDEIAVRAYVAGDRVSAAKLQTLPSLTFPGGAGAWLLAAYRLPLPPLDAEALLIALAEDHSERIQRAMQGAT